MTRTRFAIFTTMILTAAAIIGSQILFHKYWPRVAPTEMTLEVCFTPGGDCTDQIVGVIGTAKQEVLVQAFGFTSMPIVNALAEAHTVRKLPVSAVLDKSNRNDPRYKADDYLRKEGVSICYDTKVAIAHSKVIIIDGKHVITGSFNFTDSAQKRNAENVLIVWNNPELAARFMENWHSRHAVSECLR